MRRLLTAFSTEERLQAAAEFLTTHSGEEILVVAATRTAADELIRRCCRESRVVFGVHRFTLPQLAFLLASERLAQEGRSFLTGVAMDAIAARAVQTCRTGSGLSWFEPVALTPGFFHALAATLNELRLNNVGPDAIRAAGPSGKDLASLLELFTAHLQETEAADLASAYRTAAAVIAEPGFRFAGRPLLLLDLLPSSALEQETIENLSRAASTVLATVHTRDASSVAVLQNALGVAAEALRALPLQGGEPPKAAGGCAEADRALDRLRAHVFETSAPEGALDSSVEFLSATDEGRECVEIARSALTLAESGVPFDEMAVALRNPAAYQPALEDAMRRAGIPVFFSMGSRRPNPSGRALLALLDCAAEGLSASRFSEYLSLGQVPELQTEAPKWIPIQGELFPDLHRDEVREPDEDASVDDNTPVVSGTLRTPYLWERLLVDAAVIGGYGRWVRRLDGLANEFRKQLHEAQRDDDSVKLHLERQLDRLASLRKFALPIIDSLANLPERASWDAWLDALEALAALALRQPELVLSVLTELRPMGNIGGVVLGEVREVLSHRLTFLRAEAPERRYGHIFVATPDELPGLSFDVVFLPGLAEDNFPKKAFEDPLLLDDARRQISSCLLTQDMRIGRERLFLHIAAGAARSRLWMSYPRMNLGQGRARNPSFYALDVLRAVTGKVPSLEELQQQSALQARTQMGWPAPRSAAAAIDDAEYDLAVIGEVLRFPRDDAAGRARYLLTANAHLGRSLRSRAGRWRRRWMEADGVVAAGPDDKTIAALLPHRTTARPYSATALQQFAACPYRFVLYSIHRLRPREDAVAIERIDALTRGSLFHEAQFRLLSELRTRGLLPIATDITPLADEVLDDIAETYREELAPAIPTVWESQIEDIRWDLRGWVREMSRAENSGWIPKWFELSFGLPAARDRDPSSRNEPVELRDGVRVRGAIDMVEEHGETIRITDHKTGRALTRHPGVTGEGEILQPVLYAQAAETLLGKRAESARLFYCTERGGYAAFEIPIDGYARDALASAIRKIDQSIAEGFLPAAPREGACGLCDYRVVCGPYEELRTRQKHPDRLALLTELRETP
jgi:RecB family exonuclease